MGEGMWAQERREGIIDTVYVYGRNSRSHVHVIETKTCSIANRYRRKQLDGWYV